MYLQLHVLLLQSIAFCGSVYDTTQRSEVRDIADARVNKCDWLAKNVKYFACEGYEQNV